MAHMIVELGKFQDLLGESVSWRLRNTNSLVLVWVQQSENRDNDVGSRLMMVYSRPRKIVSVWARKKEKASAPVLRPADRTNSLLRMSFSSVFCFIRPSCHGMGPADIKESNLLCSVPWLKCSCHLKTPAQKHPE